MSVLGLSSTTINIYGVLDTQDAYGANYPDYYPKYSDVPCRIRYMSGDEKFVNGKEQNPGFYRIYIPQQLNIIETDLIVDQKREAKYDPVFVNDLDFRGHMQIDAKFSSEIMGYIHFYSSSSSSSSYVNNWSSSSNSTSSSSSDSSSSSSSGVN